MRLFIAVLAALGFAAAALAAPTTGPALGQALAGGAVDPMTFDFGALRYAPGQTMGFLGAQAGAQLAAAKAHDKPNWPAVLEAHICPTAAERMTMAGFDSALIAPDAATWTAEKAAAEAAYARYTAARDAVLAGRPSPYPEFKAEELAVSAANRAGKPEAKALFLHRAQEQFWRHAVAYGGAKGYAEGVGKAGVVWLNARILDEGCRADRENIAWLKETLTTIPWFDTKTYGKDADASAWLIVEHADADPAFQTMVLERIGQLVVEHRSNPADYAFLWDRLALNSGRPQRYGTQMRCVNKQWAPKAPLEEPAKLDERRRWVGLPSEADAERTSTLRCV